MNRKKGAFSAYAVASQFAFVILSPLLVFIVGGHYACEYYGLPDWVMVVCILLGVLFMIGGAVSHLMKMIPLYGRDEKKPPRYNTDPRDNDYYDDYSHLHK